MLSFGLFTQGVARMKKTFALLVALAFIVSCPLVASFISPVHAQNPAPAPVPTPQPAPVPPVVPPVVNPDFTAVASLVGSYWPNPSGSPLGLFVLDASGSDSVKPIVWSQKAGPKLTLIVLSPVGNSPANSFGQASVVTPGTYRFKAQAKGWQSGEWWQYGTGLFNQP